MAWAVLTGCTTTTRLENVATPTFDQAVEELAARPGAYARLAVPPLQPLADGAYPIIDHQPGLVTVSDQVKAVQVPVSQVQAVSTYDHRRGAIEGGLSAGAVGFVLGFAARTLIFPRGCAADAPCDGSLPIGQAAAVGAIFGLVTGAIGAIVGGAMGHETRYELARPSARVALNEGPD